MLYKLHTNILIVGVLTIGLMAVKVYDRAFSVMTFSSVISFISQLCLLLYFSREKEATYSCKILFLTVLCYTLAMGGLLMGVSYYYDGDTFMFSKADAMFYYTHSMKFANYGVVKGFKYIIHNFESDDWGALLLDGVLMSIIPSKLFLNAFYTLIGTFSSVMLFKIGRHFMPESYTFLAALGYSTSSYMLFFNCSFLKESAFVFFVISAVYFLYQSIACQSRASMAAAFLFIVIIVFFRPAVAAMLVVSIFTYYGIVLRKRAVSVFLYVVAAATFAVGMKSMMDIVESNTLGGDMDAVIADTSNAAYSGGFNYFVSFFGAFLGPFPTLFNPPDAPPTPMGFLGAGLSYKLFLILPFWFGVFMAVKKWMIELFPLIAFVLLEMIATAYVCASLELRKVILHVPFMYILSSFGLYYWSKTTHSMRLYSWLNFAYAVGVLILWNVIRVKTSYD